MKNTNLASEVRRELLNSLAELGFNRIGTVSYDAYTPDQGDLLRYFSPYLALKDGGVSVLGKIGLVMPSFEELWMSQEGDCSSYAPLGMLIDNCISLVEVPLFNYDNLNKVQPWIEKIAVELHNLPETIDDLYRAVNSERLYTYPIHFFFIPNKKSNEFLKWVRKLGEFREYQS